MKFSFNLFKCAIYALQQYAKQVKEPIKTRDLNYIYCHSSHLDDYILNLEVLDRSGTYITAAIIKWDSKEDKYYYCYKTNLIFSEWREY